MTDIPINPVTRRVQFAGTTGTGPFAFNFNILQATDIVVLKNNVVLSIGTGSTNYSVSIASNGTGSVSLVTALISSDTLIIMGGRELSRTTDFVTAGDLLASSLNEQLDSNVVMSQQIDEKVNRSIIAQPGDKLVGVNLSLPLVADRANEVIKFDASGNVTTIPVSEIVGADIDTQKITFKTSAGATKLVINGNITDLITAAGNLNIVSTSGDIDFKPGGGQINLLGTSGQQRIALDNSAQATMQYFQNSNVTKLGVVDPTATRTILLPNASDTLVGKATTDTLTNKTLASPVITGSLGVTTLTGSGDIILDAVGDIVLDAAGDQVFFKDGGALRITFELGAAGTSMVSASELVMAVTNGGINFKPQSGNVDFLQNSGAQAVQINSGGSSTITYHQNSNTTKLGVVNPTASRVLLLPNASDTLVGLATTDTLTNKTLASPSFTGNLNFSGDIALDAAGDITLDADGGQIFIKDGGALKLTFTGSTLTSTGLDGINLFSSNDIALKAAGGQVDFLASDGSQRILINNGAAPTIKYFQNSNTTSLGITNPTGTRLLLLPNASDTLVGKATTDTLTNKTLNSPIITGGLNMSDVNITNVGSISLDRIANDGGTGITLDSSVSIVIDSGNGQTIFKQNGSTRLTFTTNSSGLQTLTSAGIFSLTATSDINLRPNGGQLYVLNNAGGDNFQFNTSSTPTLGIHQNSNVTNLGLVNPTATRNILFPNASDTLVGKATTDTLTNKTLTSPVINTGVSGSAFLDEDNFASNSATKIASQQSIKAYVDAATAGGGAGSLSTVLGIGNTTGSNNVLFGDNNKAIFGAGSDLQIYHNGSDSIIADVGTGHLKLLGNDMRINNADTSKSYFSATNGGSAILYHNGSAKLATTSTGIDITGTATMDGLTVDATTATIQDDSANLRFENSAGTRTGYIQNRTTAFELWNDQATPTTFGTNNTERMRIDSSGHVMIGTTTEGSADTDELTLSGSGRVGMTIRSTDSNSSRIYFSDATSGNGEFTGFIVYDHSSNHMRFGTNEDERMRIDSSGRVGIGTTPNNSLVVRGPSSNGSGSTSNVAQFEGPSGTNGYQFFVNDTANVVGLQTKSADGFVINPAGGFVGIKTGTGNLDYPLAGLHVSDGTNVRAPQNANRAATIIIDAGATASADIQFLVRNGYNSHIFFGDAADPNIGMLYYDHAANAMVINTNASEAMRIDSSGNLLVGKASTAFGTAGATYAAAGNASLVTNGGSALFLNRLSSDGSIAEFYKDGSLVGSIGVSSGALGIDGGSGFTGLHFATSVIAPKDNGSLNDGGVGLGNSNYRFDDIFATNGTIQTSDRNEKQDIAALTSTEMLVAKRISVLFKTFRWKDKVAVKGDNARTHSGIIAQDVQSAFEAESLDAGNYSMFISGSWWEHDVDVAAVEADDTVDPAIEAVAAYTRTDTYDTEDEAPEGSTKKTRLGIRYPELLSFLAGYNEQRFAAIETRLTALEG